MCRDVIQCTGLCTRPRIPAQLIEGHVLRHLDAFVGKDLEAWIAERLATRTDEQADLERTLDARRSELVALERRREQRMTELETVGITQLGLEVIERIDAEREGLSATVADIEARLERVLGGAVLRRDPRLLLLDPGRRHRPDRQGHRAERRGRRPGRRVRGHLGRVDGAGLRAAHTGRATPEGALRAAASDRTLGWLPAGEPIRVDDPIAVIPGIERDVLPPET